jgi:hypothetical protein
MISNEATVPLGRVDCAALTEKVLSLDESAWLADARRQEDFDVHAQTQSIILTFCEGWPEVTVSHAAGWDLLAAEAAPVMEQILSRHYPPGGQVLRAMMARLPAGGRIARHTDGHPSFSVAHRIHVPLVTNPGVEFVVGRESVPPRAHFAFELNNLMAHSVVNNGDRARIHFIFDYAPPPVTA